MGSVILRLEGDCGGRRGIRWEVGSKPLGNIGSDPFGRFAMKKIALALLMVLLVSGGKALAFRGGGGTSGGGSWGGGGTNNGGGWSGGGASGDRGGGGSWNSGGTVGSSRGTGGSWSGSGRVSSGGSYHNNGSRWGSGRSYSSGWGLRNGGNVYSHHAWNGAWSRNNGGFGTAQHHFQRANSFNGYQGWGGGNKSAQGLHHFTASNSRPTLKSSSARPQALANRSILPNSLRHSSPAIPARSPSGHGFSARSVPPSNMSSSEVKGRMATVAGDKAFLGRFGINSQYRPNHYYWNNWNGNNYCFYRDGWGGDWCGWNCGAGFFWTQYYCGNWWWEDPWTDNWCYWNAGNWCWQNPVNTNVYVYENGNYVPANGDNGYVQDQGNNGYQSAPVNNETQMESYNSPTDRQNLTSEEGEIIFQSEHNSRFVKLVGNNKDAFLFDAVKGSFRPVFLETNVQGVRFTGSGKNMKIQLTLQDGAVEIFKADGSMVDGA